MMALADWRSLLKSLLQKMKNKVRLPGGPVFHGDSCQLHDIQLNGYAHYSRELFECAGNRADRMGQQHNLDTSVFQMEPGRNLHGHDLFLVKVSDGSAEEVERSSTLYHGLVHSRTSDLNVKLSLPRLPDPSHTSMLGLKVPVYNEVADDEGFNESMSSDMASSTPEDVDKKINLWEAAITHKLHTKYTWETIGSFPKPTERPYLSEAGPDAFDYLYHLRKYELTLVEPSIQVQNQVELTQSDLVKDGLNILLAIPSRTFQFERETSSFHVNCNIHYKGTSPEMLSQSLAPLAEAGTQYWQLSQFAVQRSLDSMYTGGLTLQAFCSGIRTFLQLYSSRVLTVPWNSHSTISMVRHAFREFIAQLRYLWMFCMCHRRRFGRPGDPGDPLPTGIQLLSYIYQEALDCCKSQNYKVILALLRTTCGPYLMFIQDWIFNGICRDGYGEFMITANDEYLQYRDKYYWTHGYVMNTENSSSSVPMFLQELANGMYVCGKTLNLMKLCCPGHFLCNNHVPIPRLTLTFSLEELERIDKETHVYTERMHNIARRNTVSKEEKEARLEKAREDLLIQARRTAVHELNRIRGEMKQVKEAADEKKRKELKELKEQMQRDLVRRAMKIEEEKETDRKEIEEQDRIEKGIADIEGELESKAREELIEYYAKLTEDAIRRERHALWRVQRRKLDDKRMKFFQQDEADMKKELLRVNQETSISPEPLTKTLSGKSAMSSELPPSTEDQVSTTKIDFQTVVESIPPRIEQPQTSSEDLISMKGDDGTTGSSVVTDKQIDQQPGQMNLLDTSLHDFLPKPKEELFHPPDNDLDDILIEIGSELPSKDSDRLGYVQDTQKTAPDKQGARHPSESNFIVGEEIGGSSVSLPSGSVGQGCVSTIENILYSMEGKNDLPQKGDHGHASDAILTDFAADDINSKFCEHRPHLHGHSSDSTMGGLIYPKQGDVGGTIKRKQRSKWGHPSTTSDIQLGLVAISEKEDDTLKLQKVTEDEKKSGIEPVSRSANVRIFPINPHGHSSDSTVQTVLYNQELTANSKVCQPSEKNQEAVSASELSARGAYGHSSDSSIQKLLYQDIGGMERKQEAVVESGQVYRGRGLNVVGHPSDSSAGKLLYGEGNVQPLDLKIHEDAKGEIEDGLVLPLSETFKPFEDEFNQTCSLPSVDLLANAGIMPISMELGNYGISHSDTSNEAAHLLSLPAILRQSIIAPLNAQIDLVNKCILDYYIVDLNIDDYFKTLRSFLFLQDGEFGQSLCDQLFEKLAQGLRPGELFTPMVLNQILSKAIQQSLNRRSTHADKLSFSLKWLPNMFKPNAIDSLDGLELKFKIDWPCNIVITTGCLEKYNRVFSFMLQLKRASWVLRDIYFQLKRSALIHHAGNSAQFRQLQLFRHEMQHFVNVMQGYIANQVVNVSWEEFKGQLKTDVQSLDDLHNRHVEYLNKALFRCLLNKKAAPVMKIITKIFCLILKVWTQLVSSRWYYDPDIHQVVHPAFHTVRSSYSAFKEYSGFLYKVVSKLVTRGYQPHLEEFLLRLNFNDFYSEG
ncbi:gamma-tubulin complex component 6-like [Anneissia japonica]|uniref:gamma-tubulin complex component 6-like n=1 Tax=Anneissia japonica TaxID=1529436 RepID=UPI0014258461|nr:gamma-tubulin complex component 6-like [Anneissia japonica]